MEVRVLNALPAMGRPEQDYLRVQTQIPVVYADATTDDRYTQT